MTVRSLDFLDFPFFPRYRQDIIPLDSARLLTRGNPLGVIALFSYLNPRRNLYTAVASENGDSLMGQIIMSEGDTSARLTFLAPAVHVNTLALPLLDHLIRQAGDWGALHVLAEVDEESSAFKALRAANFAMYAWQRIWKLPHFTGQPQENPWRDVKDADWPSVQSLQAQIVPPLLQPVENFPKQVTGLVCFSEIGLQAFAVFSIGPEGVLLQPLVPPDSTCFQEQIVGLVQAMSGPAKRTVYVCVRSYQAWLESSLMELGAEAGPRQAVMVRRLTKTVKEPQTISAMEKVLAKAKPAAPVRRIDIER
jgi:hypothetical protein